MPHLFISENAGTFPSWQKVFPDHQITSPELSQPEGVFDIVWFKLSFQKDLSSQLVWLFDHYSQHKIVILSHIPRFEEAIQCLKGGARAYANAFAGPKTLIQIAEVVNEGGIWLGADLMQALITSSQKINNENDQAISEFNHANEFEKKLSKREFAVAKLIAEGDSNKIIARKLNIAERTVKSHVSTIFTKLEVKDRLKLALLFNTK